MFTIRMGSVGVDVATWQRVLGLNPDGVFGPRTHDRTIAFQRAHGLTADGVVGPATWAAGGCVVAPSVVEGVDLSIAQAGARVDFERLFAAGVRFVVVRTQAGEAAPDATFRPFIAAARAAGHLVSVYQYALADADFADDADALLSAIDSVPIDFPAWLDVESLNGRTPAQVIDFVGGWVERYRARRGHRPTIYTGKGFWGLLGSDGTSALAKLAVGDCRLASAAYGAAFPPVFGPWSRATFHQWAGNSIATITKPWAHLDRNYAPGDQVWGSNARAAVAAGVAVRVAAPGIVDGVDGEVDRDRFFGTLDELRGLTDADTFA